MVAPLIAAKAHTVTVAKAKAAVAAKVNVAAKPAITWYKSAIAAGWKKSYRLHRIKLTYKKFLRYSSHYLKWQRHYAAKARYNYGKRMYWWKRAMKLRWSVAAAKKHYNVMQYYFKRRAYLLKYYAKRYNVYRRINYGKYARFAKYARRCNWIAKGFAKTAKHFAQRKDTLGLARSYARTSKYWAKRVKPAFKRAYYHLKWSRYYSRKSASHWRAWRATKSNHGRFSKYYYSKLYKY